MIVLVSNNLETEGTDFSSPEDRKIHQRALRESFQHRLSEDLNGDQTVRLGSAITEDGEVFEALEFIVTARYRKNGEWFLSGSGFAINLSRFYLDLGAAPEDVGVKL